MEAIALSIGTVIGSEGHRKWRVLSRLGSGAFGAVFLVQEEGKKDNRYALKAERLSAQVQMLAVEVQVYQALMSGEGTTLEGQKRRYPLLIDKGAWNNQYNYLVMSLVGPSLEVSKREIKPANFSIGHGDTGVIYILDFGMARCFVRPDGVLKRPRAGNIGFRGTAKYASRIGHKHKELCRGDDVESWFYMACELLRGKFPCHRIDVSLLYLMFYGI
uniref:Protein kinase domain-containing protein n=1 Tax=Meloidogyne hapla TaxID=6305 RepID=A0A1I8BE17_MELHA